jgi:hypothetical protein
MLRQGCFLSYRGTHKLGGKEGTHKLLLLVLVLLLLLLLLLVTVVTVVVVGTGRGRLGWCGCSCPSGYGGWRALAALSRQLFGAGRK